jgi:hypothetical protein
VANDTQGVNSGSDKLVTQPKLPGNTARTQESALGFKGVTQAGSPGNTTTSRESMKLVTQAKVPGGDTHGESKS